MSGYSRSCSGCLMLELSFLPARCSFDKRTVFLLLPRARRRSSVQGWRRGAEGGVSVSDEGSDWQVRVRELQSAAFEKLHKGTHHCSWMGDPYDARRKAVDVNKGRTNDLFRQALQAALADPRITAAEERVLLLDGPAGISSHIAIDVGLPPHGVRPQQCASTSLQLVPLQPPPPSLLPCACGCAAFTLMVTSLKQEWKVNAFLSDVGDYLGARAPDADPFLAVWLDYCGSVARRVPQLQAVFKTHSVADGGVLALGFSCREVGGSNTRAEHGGPAALCQTTLDEAAHDAGYYLDDAIRYDYDGMFFLVCRVWVRQDSSKRRMQIRDFFLVSVSSHATPPLGPNNRIPLDTICSRDVGKQYKPTLRSPGAALTAPDRNRATVVLNSSWDVELIKRISRGALGTKDSTFRGDDEKERNVLWTSLVKFIKSAFEQKDSSNDVLFDLANATKEAGQAAMTGLPPWTLGSFYKDVITPLRLGVDIDKLDLEDIYAHVLELGQHATSILTTHKDAIDGRGDEHRDRRPHDEGLRW
ncbi:hypothetical protein CYMTET_54096 [Cymbomonas tetramitiformis]|uniref:Uncharacterized protein n=1 Tax=Cymbomonas tetramitiformis TaxID=36881 RepID=A0AAE0ER31_9CHLO|nr:hypothetical protein CYMTET_54096 [Cymbomonas tetramitiformis]